MNMQSEPISCIPSLAYIFNSQRLLTVKNWNNDLHLAAQLTMSNVPPRSPTLWVHCISTWVVSFYAYWVRDVSKVSAH